MTLLDASWLNDLNDFYYSPATQAQQEAGVSTTVAVTPGRQQFHPSAAKWWAFVTVSGGTPTIAASYNVTSITDDAPGTLTVTIATGFSSANWVSLALVRDATGAGAVAGYQSSAAAGSQQFTATVGGSDTSLADPTSWSLAGLGDQ